jgi:hypothetical protein
VVEKAHAKERNSMSVDVMNPIIQESIEAVGNHQMCASASAFLSNHLFPVIRRKCEKALLEIEGTADERLTQYMEVQAVLKVVNGLEKTLASKCSAARQKVENIK